nr:hypothetical protein [uncultured Caproiciproducens sp.]
MKIRKKALSLVLALTMIVSLFSSTVAFAAEANSLSTAKFVSDTTMDLNVHGVYQIKITSTDGQAPTLVAGTSGVFSTHLVRSSGNDYYIKITAIGMIGAKSGIYVNGVKLLVATVAVAAIMSDTTNDFSVNGVYVIKITRIPGRASTIVPGTSGVFTIKLARTIGDDLYYKITAIGKPGVKSGIYVNQVKLLVATVGATA